MDFRLGGRSPEERSRENQGEMGPLKLHMLSFGSYCLFGLKLAKGLLITITRLENRAARRSFRKEAKNGKICIANQVDAGGHDKSQR